MLATPVMVAKLTNGTAAESKGKGALANNGRCTYRNSNSRIKLQYPYTLDYSALETDIDGRCVSLQKAQRKRRQDYPDAEVARRDRAAQSSQATKNCRVSETAEARERRSTRDRDRRKRRLDSESATHDACIAETTFHN